MKYSPQTSKVTTGVLGGAIVGTSTPHHPAQPVKFSAAEWIRLAGFYGFIALLHIAGCGLLFYYARQTPALLGLGFAAYMFGLRHAFDADHIAAVDDTVRYLMQKGQKPLGVGFFSRLAIPLLYFYWRSPLRLLPRKSNKTYLNGSITAALLARAFQAFFYG